MKKFLYFQPEYVSRFKCDGSKCDARCCKAWNIYIETAAYKKYSRIKPKEKAEEILSHFEYNESEEKYFLKESPCPFLTEKNLCSLQLEYGENFLSATCATYPRQTHSFGKFFERSLTLTCPVAAEMILFAQEPLKFEFVEVPDKIHSRHGKLRIQKFPTNANAGDFIREVQVTMITILQEQWFTLDQRLIVLGSFTDKLQDLFLNESGIEDMLKLIGEYRSKEFLFTKMPTLLQKFSFEAEQFVMFMIEFINPCMEILDTAEGKKFFVAFTEFFGIKPDENSFSSLDELTANFERLTEARENFLEKYSTFLENYLVNELFSGVYPWRFREQNLTKNFAVLLIHYKIFEMMTFAATESGLDSKEDLPAMVSWFMTKTDRNPKLYEKFFELLAYENDTHELMETLLEP